MEMTPETEFRWLRPASPGRQALEAHRQWLIGLARRPLYSFFGRTRDETIKIQRRAKLRRFLRSRTHDQLDALIVNQDAPAALRQAARQHRKFRSQIVTTTTIRKRQDPQLPVLHHSAQTVVSTLQKVGAVRTKTGTLVGHLYEAKPQEQPRTRRLAGVEVAVSLLQAVIAEQQLVGSFYKSVRL